MLDHKLQGVHDKLDFLFTQLKVKPYQPDDTGTSKLQQTTLWQEYSASQSGTALSSSNAHLSSLNGLNDSSHGATKPIHIQITKHSPEQNFDSQTTYQPNTSPSFGKGASRVDLNEIPNDLETVPKVLDGLKTVDTELDNEHSLENAKKIDFKEVSEISETEIPTLIKVLEESVETENTPVYSSEEVVVSQAGFSTSDQAFIPTDTQTKSEFNEKTAAEERLDNNELENKERKNSLDFTRVNGEINSEFDDDDNLYDTRPSEQSASKQTVDKQEEVLEICDVSESPSAASQDIVDNTDKEKEKLELQVGPQGENILAAEQAAELLAECKAEKEIIEEETVLVTNITDQNKPDKKEIKHSNTDSDIEYQEGDVETEVKDRPQYTPRSMSGSKWSQNFTIVVSRKRPHFLSSSAQERKYTPGSLRKVLKKTKTWSSNDNRPLVLKKIYNIMDGGNIIL